MCICGTINVATLVSDESLHNPRALGAAHGLGDIPGRHRDVEARAVVDGQSHLVEMLDKSELEPVLPRKLLPLVELLDDSQDRQAVARHDRGGPFGQQNPSGLVLVGEKLLDLSCD